MGLTGTLYGLAFGVAGFVLLLSYHAGRLRGRDEGKTSVKKHLTRR